MISVVIFLPAIYFGIGALAVLRITRRRKDAKFTRTVWTKYAVYAVIVAAVLLSIRERPVFQLLFFIIAGMALTELMVWLRNPSRRTLVLVIALLVFGTAAGGFYFYVTNASLNQAYAVYLLVFTFDGFSQIAGQLFGKTSLLPKISPGKTVEGLIGGFAFTLLTAFLITEDTPQLPGGRLLFALAISAAAFTGDLLASLYKRRNHAKDFSRLIPGHGGMLDRFDSFLAAGAAYALLALIFPHSSI